MLVFNSALTATDDLWLNSTEGGGLSLLLCWLHVEVLALCSPAHCCRAHWNSQAGFVRGNEETL